MIQSVIKPQPENTTLVLLCGGMSRRMNGQDKGLLLLKDQAIYQQTLNRLKNQVGQVIISANRNLGEYDKSGYQVIRDTLPDHPGPLAGLLAAMQQIHTDWILTAPCDMPYLPDDLFERFQSAAEQAALPVALVAYDGHRQQNLVCLLQKGLQSSLQHFIDSGQRAAHHWLRQLSATRVDFSEIPEAFININTPDELAEVERQIG
jgi:molybdopterin-guanine dinucleotide biosynthesis protein A